MPSFLSEQALTLFAVMNHEGQWYRAKGYYGASWVDDINTARIYSKIGPARALVTYLSNSEPTLPTPQLVKLTVTQIEAVDETARVQKSRRKAAVAAAKQRSAAAERKLEQAKRTLAEAMRQIQELS